MTFIRAFALSTAFFALVLAGCGGDDEPKRPDAVDRPPPAGSTATQETQTSRTDDTRRYETATAPAPPRTGTSPEDQEGGAGDEEARAPAVLTGRGGRISPRVVRVPPFIAIRVELRSADRQRYGIRFGGEVAETGPQVGSATLTLDGLRPNESVTGVPVGRGGNPVRIVADAEPGP